MDLPRPAFLRQAGAGFALGLATMLPMTLAMLGLGILAPRPGIDAATLLAAFAVGTLMGLAVAFVEETFFRGLMFRAISRESGYAAAAWLTAHRLRGDPLLRAHEDPGRRGCLGQRV